MQLLDSEPAPPRRQIHSWKSIAEYLQRDVRTVQRWEKTAGLPVRRLKHDARSSVFAWSDELDAWVQSRSEGGPAEESTAAPRSSAPAAYAVAAIVACVAGILIWSGFKDDRIPAAAVPVSSRPLTFEPGINWGARLSPDATRIAYSRRLEPDAPSVVVVRPLSGGDEIVVNATPLNEHSPAWAPSGAELAFLRGDSRGFADLVVAKFPELDERTVVRLRAPDFSLQSIVGPSQLDWSPDGRFLLTTEQESLDAPYRITVIEASTGRRRFVTDPGPGSVQAHGDLSPRWSPDGRAFLALRRINLHEIRLGMYPFRGMDASGPPRFLPMEGEPDRKAVPRQASWTPDGAHIVYDARSVSSPTKHLWRVSTGDTPEVERVLVGALRATEPDVREAPDGRWTMTYTSADADVDIVEIPLVRKNGAPVPGPQESWRTIADSLTDDNRPSVSPDGSKLAFTSPRSGSMQVWIADLRTGDVKQVSNLPPSQLGDKVWSPDGERVTFIAFGPKGRDLMTVRIADGHTRTVVAGDRNEWPAGYSPDGRTLYFLRWPELWSVDLKDGTETRAPNSPRMAGVKVNPRGGFIYWIKQKFYSMSDLDAEPVFLFESTLWAPTSFEVRESGVYFLSNDQRLGYYGFDDATVRTLVRFSVPLRAGVTVSAKEDYAYVTVLKRQMQIMAADDVRGLF